MACKLLGLRARNIFPDVQHLQVLRLLLQPGFTAKAYGPGLVSGSSNQDWMLHRVHLFVPSSKVARLGDTQDGPFCGELRNDFSISPTFMRRIFGCWQGTFLVRSIATGQKSNAASGQKGKHNVGFIEI